MATRKAQAASSIFKNQSFYIRVLSTFIGLLVIAVLPIILFNYWGNRHIVSQIGEDLMQQTSKMVIEKVSNHFMPAAVSVQISSMLAGLGAISCRDYDQVLLYTLGVLKYHPQVSMFYLADEEGNYIRSWRLPDGTMEGRSIRPGTSPPTDTFKYYDADFKVFRTEQATTIDYDPRVRGWYIGAKEIRANFWTDVYYLFRNQKPAITSAYPVIGANGEILGVWAMDIELESISQFLQNLKIGQSGIALIVDRKNEIVAYPDLDRIRKEENGAFRPIRVEELGNNPVTAVFREHVSTGRNRVTATFEGEKYFATFSAFPSTFPIKWEIVLVVPEEDFTGGATKLMMQTVLICSVLLGIAILLAFSVARAISRPIGSLAEETGRIKDFDLVERPAVTSYIKEIQLMSNAISSMKAGLQAFQRYVPAELVRLLIRTGEGANVGGHKRELTVMFSDIEGFTTITEKMPAEELMVHLSEYFDELTRILSRNNGTVDKYIGDGILAFWGAPLSDARHAFHACDAALLCQEKVRELNLRWEGEGKSPFVTRIGISTGETLVGNVGSSERINYTVMGDNVNLASRLEGVNKLFHTRIMVNRGTYEAVADKFWFRALGVVRVKGKSEAMAIYELMGRKTGDEAGETAALCSEFTRGVTSYLNREWDSACEIFDSLAAKFPSDGPSGFYLTRCRHYRDNPPSPESGGVEYLEFK